MADFPARNAPEVIDVPGDLPTTAALVAYALMGAAGVACLFSSGFHFIAPLFGFLGIAAVIICYFKRSEAAGTWIASHLRWMIRTFWFSLLGSIVGWIFAVTIVGLVIAIPLWFVVSIWILYRVVRGYLWFKDGKQIPGM